jgi:hypothetical protein
MLSHLNGEINCGFGFQKELKTESEDPVPQYICLKKVYVLMN